MAKEVVLLFAGQGAQTVGMGADLMDLNAGVRQWFEAATSLLGYDLAAVMKNGPIEELTRTSRCQPALYLHGLACWELLRERVPDLQVTACAGLSLGEFTAHAVAGTYAAMAGLEVVWKRGLYMEEAASANPGSMAAMIGGDDESVAKLAAACGVEVANYNAPGQTVISGPRAGILRAIDEAEAFGIRGGKELQVAGAYHSRLMQAAQDKLTQTLAKVDMSRPQWPVICNLEAREVWTAEEIRNTLTRQVTGSVRWAASMAQLLQRGCRTFVELGPGGVLAGLMRRIERPLQVSAQVITVHDLPSLEKAVERLSAATAG